MHIQCERVQVTSSPIPRPNPYLVRLQAASLTPSVHQLLLEIVSGWAISKQPYYTRLSRFIQSLNPALLSAPGQLMQTTQPAEPTRLSPPAAACEVLPSTQTVQVVWDSAPLCCASMTPVAPAPTAQNGVVDATLEPDTAVDGLADEAVIEEVVVEPGESIGVEDEESDVIGPTARPRPPGSVSVTVRTDSRAIAVQKALDWIKDNLKNAVVNQSSIRVVRRGATIVVIVPYFDYS